MRLLVAIQHQRTNTKSVFRIYSAPRQSIEKFYFVEYNYIIVESKHVAAD
jgi:hypothetical protein